MKRPIGYRLDGIEKTAYKVYFYDYRAIKSVKNWFLKALLVHVSTFNDI